MKGSQWKRWNMHVHTKGTNKNDQFTSSTMDDFFYVFFKQALANGISAIGITDYFTIDNYKLAIAYVSEIAEKKSPEGEALFTPDEMKAVGEIFLFPNVELRMIPSTGVGKLINIHCIFNPDYVASLDNDFFNTLENQDRQKMNRAGFEAYGKQLNPALEDPKAMLKLGIDNFVVDPKTVKDLLDKNKNFRENTIVVVSNSNKDGNSGFQKHYDVFEGEPGALDGVRKTIYYLSDAVFSTNPKDVSYFLGKRLDEVDDITAEAKEAEIQKVITERGSLKSCLVGCDAHTETDLFSRFTWIKADLNFDGLKQIIFEPEQRVKIQDAEPDVKDDKLVIEQVQFISNDHKFTSEPIKFNRNLNVIIGGKSSGKSILLYNIARTLLPNRKILKNESSQGYKYEFGDNFKFEVKIGSGQTALISRSDDEPSILSEIKYIPQNYLSKLAEPENKKGNELLKLVRDLLLEDEIYNQKYQDFISKVKSNDLNRETSINTYFEIKDRINSLKNELIQKGSDAVLQESVKVNTAKIQKLKEDQGLSEDQLEAYDTFNTELERQQLEMQQLSSDFSKITSFHTDSTNILQDLVNKKNLLLDTLLNPTIRDYYTKSYAFLDSTIQAIQVQIESIELNANNQFERPNIFMEEAANRRKKIDELKSQLEPFVKDQVVKKQIMEIEALILEDKQKLGTIEQLKNEITKNETALGVEKEKIFADYRANFDEYGNVINQFDGRTDLLKNDNLNIDGKVKFNFPKFREKLLGASDGRKASFSHFTIFDEKNTGVSEYDINDVLAQLQNIFEGIVERKDYFLTSRFDEKSAVKILLEDYFFDYWEVIYDNDTLDKMSTGKASFVILMLIVGLSRSKAPILIDQPEDNLDNRSITKDLVEYLRNKKLERQIILVTHNPNVVVNADSENVIIANQKGQNDKETTSLYDFDYINGPIENSFEYQKTQTDLLKSMGIREHIADIVEGGKEAFKKRERKYGFSRFR
ncbi:hypothetical protein OQZ33_17245 [Pedobacter sp. MC2016-05]|uniref:TrlF family AAA-like ATPase n=1 Tax=Pedobacter sp. MC2016-05 TaxID=2994474 RepID=UPI0022451B8F|nr:hypothetical protein [Pedobacter sp. MC2016-05]MCX2476083.1 hypothetical protein [Pedobacter sp. MC2016-05]